MLETLDSGQICDTFGLPLNIVDVTKCTDERSNLSSLRPFLNFQLSMNLFLDVINLRLQSYVMTEL